MTKDNERLSPPGNQGSLPEPFDFGFITLPKFRDAEKSEIGTRATPAPENRAGIKAAPVPGATRLNAVALYDSCDDLVRGADRDPGRRAWFASADRAAKFLFAHRSGVELEILRAGNALGLGLVAWSPLSAGLLTGKYDREKIAEAGPAGSLPNRLGESNKGGSDGRLNGDTPFGGMLFTETNFRIVDELRVLLRNSADRWRK